MSRKVHHPLLHRFDLETRARIMVSTLESKARLLQARGYDPKPAVQWMNEILPLVRMLSYSKKHPVHENHPLPEDEVQKHWEEFIILFLDDISGIRE